MVGTDGSVATVGTAGSDGPGFDLGTEGDWSAIGTVTSFAPLASSPQWGQNLRSFKMEAQSRWKRWEMLPYGLHSMKVPCGTDQENTEVWQSIWSDHLNLLFYYKPAVWNFLTVKVITQALSTCVWPHQPLHTPCSITMVAPYVGSCKPVFAVT